MEQINIGNYKITQIHQRLLEILIELDRICRKFKIKYTLEGGSLLGAVKYGGFVPWDDDIDIAMLREDYEKFIEVCSLELDKKFFLQNTRNTKEFPLNYSKLCINDTVYSQKAYQKLNIHQGIFIDIFPIDTISKMLFRPQCALIGLFTGARITKLKLLEDKKLRYSIVSFLPINVINKLSDFSIRLFNFKKGLYVYELCNVNYKFPPLPREVYENVIDIDFMGRKVMASAQFDIFLKTRFGNDYMDTLPDQEKRKPSHGIIECKL